MTNQGEVGRCYPHQLIANYFRVACFSCLSVVHFETWTVNKSTTHTDWWRNGPWHCIVLLTVTVCLHFFCSCPRAQLDEEQSGCGCHEDIIIFIEFWRRGEQTKDYRKPRKEPQLASVYLFPPLYFLIHKVFLRLSSSSSPFHIVSAAGKSPSREGEARPISLNYYHRPSNGQKTAQHSTSSGFLPWFAKVWFLASMAGGSYLSISARFASLLRWPERRPTGDWLVVVTRCTLSKSLYYSYRPHHHRHIPDKESGSQPTLHHRYLGSSRWDRV